MLEGDRDFSVEAALRVVETLVLTPQLKRSGGVKEPKAGLGAKAPTILGIVK